MKIYLVGGAVRDILMGREPKDRDYVIVGATPEDVASMLAEGYQEVGGDFPVFLHPETNEEYALARTERKVSGGYHGFKAHYDEHVTLEEDLLRRDLTINAMAMDNSGNIIDPYGGQEDLKNKLMRPVSEAFADDPVRALRAAKFAARYNFEVTSELMDMCHRMRKQGEFLHLKKERVWQELSQALMYNHAYEFFHTAELLGFIRDVFPHEVRTNTIMNSAECELALESAHAEKADLETRFAIIARDMTRDEMWRIGATSDCMDAAVRLTIMINNIIGDDYRMIITPLNLDDPKSVLSAIESLDGIRRTNLMLDAFEAHRHFVHGDQLNTNFNSFVKTVFESCVNKIKAIDNKALLSDVPKDQIKMVVHNAKIQCIEEVIKEHVDFQKLSK